MTSNSKVKKITIGEVSISEGDYITLNVPNYGDPVVYIGKAELIEPDYESSGIGELVALTKKIYKRFPCQSKCRQCKRCLTCKKIRC